MILIMSNLIVMSSIKNRIFFILLLIAVVAVIVPFSPIMPSEGLDPSWTLGMNQAYSQGLVFGRDIVFTFGPYSSIYTKAFHPSTDSLMIAGSLYFATMFFYVAYKNLKNSKIYVKILFISVISALLYSRDVLLFLYPFMVGIYLTEKLHQEDRLLERTMGIELLMLFSVFGLLPLIKGSTIFLCLAILFICMIMLLVARRYFWILILCISPIFSLVFFWGWSGQPLDNIAQYFISMMPIISGYTDAMAVNGRTSEIILYSLSALVIIASLCFDGSENSLKKIYLLFISGLLIFLGFKAGFVRHDGHAIIAALTVLLVALMFAKYFNGLKLFAVLIFSFSTWITTHVNYNKLSLQAVTANFITTYSDLWMGVTKRVNHPNALNEEYKNRLSEIASHLKIGKIDGHVDIYSYDQASLIASGNSWSPRPILQSYSVYTPELALKNANYLKKSNAPEVLLIKIQPIDGRLPSMEDGTSWPIIYSYYAFDSYNSGYLILRKKEKPYLKESVGPKLKVRLGEKVIIRDDQKVVFAKIKIKKTFIGKIISFIYKPNELKIILNLKGGVVKSYRLIAGMAESGFVISPHIESETDFILGYSGDKYLKSQKLNSFVIEPVNSSFMWNENYDVQLDDLTFEHVDAISFVDASGPIRAQENLNLYEAKRCDGGIDEIDGNRVSDSSNKTGSLMKVSGWLSPSIDTGEQYDSAYMIFENKVGKREYFQLKNMKRPDVSLAFNRNLDYVGYKTMLNLSGFSGDYFLRLAYQKKNAIYICPVQKYNLRVAND